VCHESDPKEESRHPIARILPNPILHRFPDDLAGIDGIHAADGGAPQDNRPPDLHAINLGLSVHPRNWGIDCRDLMWTIPVVVRRRSGFASADAMYGVFQSVKINSGISWGAAQNPEFLHESVCRRNRPGTLEVWTNTGRQTKELQLHLNNHRVRLTASPTESWNGLDTLESRLLLSSSMIEYFPIANGNAWNFQGQVAGEVGTAKLTSASGGSIDGIATTLFTLATKENGNTSTAKLFVTNNDEGLSLHRLQLIDSGVTTTFNFAEPLSLANAQFEPLDLIGGDEIGVTGTRTGDGTTPGFTGTLSYSSLIGEETIVLSSLGNITAFPLGFASTVSVEANDESWSSLIDFSFTFSLAQFAGVMSADVFYDEFYVEPGNDAELISFTSSQIVTSTTLLKPQVSIEVVEPVGTEGGDSAVFRITRQSALAPEEPLTVSFTRAGTAKFGATSDYTLLDLDGNVLTTTVVIPAFADSIDIFVDVVDDLAAELDETVIINLKAGSAYSIDPLAKSATATIEDNEPRVSIEKISDTGEGLDAGVFRISRTSTTGVAKVNFTRGGTAKFGAAGDYTLSKDGTALTTTFVEIPDGEDHVDITVVPVNDSLAELTETVVLTIKAGTGFSVAPDGSVATMNLVDNEAIVSIAKIADTAEGGAAGTFRVTRDLATGPLTITFTRAGTAKFGASGDYTLSIDGSPLTATSFVMLDGVTQVDIIVTPINDTLAEPTETVILTLTTTALYTADPLSKTATLNIIDNEPIVRIAKLSDTGEGEEPGVFRISRDTTAGDLVVNFTRGGTAKFGAAADYTLSVGGQNLTGTVVIIPDGQTHVDVTVTPVNDLVAENNETVILKLKTSKIYTLDDAAIAATMTITDNEPTLSISKLSDTGEGAEPGVFRISRDTTAGDLVVNFTRGGTAKFGAAADYTLSVGGVDLAGTVVTIPDGEDHVDITVTPINDTLAEVTETVILTLKTAKTYNLDALTKSATVNITDDEPVVGIEQIDDTGEGLTPGILRIFRTTTSGDLAVNVARSGDAKFGPTGDYTLRVGGTNLTGTVVTIPDGEEHVDVEVVAVDDAVAELTESVILTITPLATYTIDAASKTATLDVEDNEERTLTINNVTITEGQSGQKQAKFTVTLSAKSSNVVTVDFSTFSGDIDAGLTGDDPAIGSSDYEDASGTLVFEPGQTTRTIIVDVFGDTEEELNEKFSVLLENATNATIIDDVGIGTIKNDDVIDLAVTGLTFSRNRFEEFQESGSLTITVTLKNVGTVTFDFAEVDIGLTPDFDFGFFTLTTILIDTPIAAGKTITRSVVINFEDEPFFSEPGTHFRVAQLVNVEPQELGNGDGEPDANNQFISPTKDVTVLPSPEF